MVKDTSHFPPLCNHLFYCCKRGHFELLSSCRKRYATSFYRSVLLKGFASIAVWICQGALKTLSQSQCKPLPVAKAALLTGISGNKQAEHDEGSLWRTGPRWNEMKRAPQAESGVVIIGRISFLHSFYSAITYAHSPYILL